MAGWQRQPGRRTVQRHLEVALGALGAGDVSVTGAGRTDAGVHATGQVAHFDMHWPGTPSELCAAVAVQLPADIAIGQLAQAPDTFHARHSAIERSYRYDLVSDRSALAVGRRMARARSPLVVAWMREAAARLIGAHDFGAFGARVVESGTTVRRVDRIAVGASGARVWIEVAGNAFLRHQVRRMVAALVEVGRGRIEAGEVAGMLDRGKTGSRVGRAPACGLTLTGVAYRPEATRNMGPAWATGRPAEASLGEWT